MTAYDYVLFTGQSLARGQTSDAAELDLAGTQAHPTNIQQITAAGAFTALQAPDPFYAYNGIVPARSFGDAVWTSGNLLVNTHAEGGKLYSQLKKGTTRYTEAINAITAGVSAHPSDTITARALHVIHGEADYSAGATKAQYLGYLSEWLSDFNADIKAITGQTANLKGFFSPPSYFGRNNITDAAVDAHNAGTYYLVCPKYQLYTTPNIHLLAPGYFYLGEYHARAHRAVFASGTWSPLMPLAATYSTRTINVTFRVPTPPIQLDTTLVASVANSGFSVADDGGAKTISSVTVTGSDRVTIVVSTDLGTNPVVRYGATNAGGNLRDSETAVSAYDGHGIPNWCVHFEQAATPIPRSPGVNFAPSHFIG